MVGCAYQTTNKQNSKQVSSKSSQICLKIGPFFNEHEMQLSPFWWRSVAMICCEWKSFSAISLMRQSDLLVCLVASRLQCGMPVAHHIWIWLLCNLKFTMATENYINECPFMLVKENSSYVSEEDGEGERGKKSILYFEVDKFLVKGSLC